VELKELEVEMAVQIAISQTIRRELEDLQNKLNETINVLSPTAKRVMGK